VGEDLDSDGKTLERYPELRYICYPKTKILEMTFKAGSLGISVIQSPTDFAVIKELVAGAQAKALGVRLGDVVVSVGGPHISYEVTMQRLALAERPVKVLMARPHGEAEMLRFYGTVEPLGFEDADGGAPAAVSESLVHPEASSRKLLSGFGAMLSGGLSKAGELTAKAASSVIAAVPAVSLHMPGVGGGGDAAGESAPRAAAPPRKAAPPPPPPRGAKAAEPAPLSRPASAEFGKSILHAALHGGGGSGTAVRAAAPPPSPARKPAPAPPAPTATNAGAAKKWPPVGKK
jgi:hypothetical protein